MFLVKDLQKYYCWILEKELVQESKYKRKNLKFEIREQKSRARSQKCENKSKRKNNTKTRQKEKNETWNDFMRDEKKNATPTQREMWKIHANNTIKHEELLEANLEAMYEVVISIMKR